LVLDDPDGQDDVQLLTVTSRKQQQAAVEAMSADLSEGAISKAAGSNADVDLVMRRAVKNKVIAKEIDRTKKLILTA